MNPWLSGTLTLFDLRGHSCWESDGGTEEKGSDMLLGPRHGFTPMSFGSQFVFHIFVCCVSVRLARFDPDTSILTQAFFLQHAGGAEEVKG